MRAIIFSFFLSLSIFTLTFSSMVFKECNQGLRDLDISALAVSETEPNLAYAGSGRALYKTEDGGGSWQAALNLKGSNKGINFIAFNRQDSSIVYAATQDGLFMQDNPVVNLWTRLFSGLGESERFCVYVAADGNNIFLGTKAGLFISQDKGKNWHKAQGELGDSAVNCLDLGQARVFASTSDKLFASPDLGKSWQAVFSFGLPKEKDEQDSDSGDDDADADLDKEGAEASYIFIPRDNPEQIYLAANAAVFASSDNAGSFLPVYSAGLSQAGIRNILAGAGNIYAATKSGVFVLAKDKQSWRNVYAGLISSDIRFAALDSLGRLWLATDKGIFRSSGPYEPGRENPSADKRDNWRFYFKDEPTINQVQAAAIKYAEVIDPKRIENLRRGARLKALMPDFDLDYDKTIYGSTSQQFVYVGPQDWSLGFSWDLGDLVWSDQQRLIDSQVRLMVELRDDIISEVTRLYFERRKLQAELFLSPPQEPKAILEKELRLDELTAYIDGLTGGYLSRQSGR
ncbi:MAG: hypothetical protein AABY43_05870 [Candidatus Omnitrophota bacterium]